jgi:glutathione synthase/RimK-type ligase-like ATP-grasp enzyme
VLFRSAKALTSTRGRTMATVPLTLADLEDADVTLCPAIYQHFIPGTRHLRINCFGERVAAFAIETEVMDWRRDHAARMTPYALDPRTSELSVGLVRKLGLEMGVLDAKLLDSGEICFLEVNPQGQFLFLEGATGVDLTGLCAGFLLERAQVAVTRQGGGAGPT